MEHSFDIHPGPRLVFGYGMLERLGELARELDFSRTLLVADRGMVDCGYADRARRLLEGVGIGVVPFHEFGENPDVRQVEAGRVVAEGERVDSILALGGGSSLDCAKGINFVLTGGGTMVDYRGHGRLAERAGHRASPREPLRMLPMIGVPTTAGTGSEAQSYALISDDETHTKMACGDQQAMFRIAILDPELTLTQPRRVTAVTGYDAISHAIESGVTRAGNAVSRLHAREAWRLLDANYERVLAEPDNREARGAMQLGAWLAGVAIEGSMLGAAHSCANPLTKNFGTPHGEAIAVVLPHIVRWNGVVAASLYAELSLPGGDGPDGDGPDGDGPDAGVAEVLACRLEELRRAGGLPETLSAVGGQDSDLEMLADEAASQWTGRFNPRDWSREGAMEIYRQAL